MFCQQCGTKMSEGDRFCHACGAPSGTSVQPVHADPGARPVTSSGGQRKGWIIGAVGGGILLIMLIGAFVFWRGGTNTVQITEYYPIHVTAAYTMEGAIDEDTWLEIVFESKGKVTLEGQDVYLNTRTFKVNDMSFNRDHFYQTDLSEGFVRAGVIYGDGYEGGSQPEWDTPPRKIFPAVMKLNEEYRYDREPGVWETHVFTGFETVTLPHETFRNTMVMESVFYWDDEMGSREVVYYEKGMGPVRVDVEEYRQGRVDETYSLTRAP